MMAIALVAAQTIGLPAPTPYPVAARRAVDLRTWAQHDAITANLKTPFIVKLPGGVVFGFHPHSNQPDDPQFKVLEREWSELKPTAVLVEGRSGPYIGKESDLVARLGEPGWAMRRAQTEKLKIWSWEPTVQAELRAMLMHGSAEDATLMLFLRTYVSRRRTGPVPDSDAASILSRRLAAYNLTGTFADLDALEAYWNSKYAGHGDWRAVPEGWKWAGEASPLAKMSAEVGDLRTSNLVLAVHDLHGKGERVLAICGSGHAIRGEPWLKRALGVMHGDR
mgnify:CR=1 FL=1